MAGHRRGLRGADGRGRVAALSGTAGGEPQPGLPQPGQPASVVRDAGLQRTAEEGPPGPAGSGTRVGAGVCCHAPPASGGGICDQQSRIPRPGPGAQGERFRIEVLDFGGGTIMLAFDDRPALG